MPDAVSSSEKPRTLTEAASQYVKELKKSPHCDEASYNKARTEISKLVEWMGPFSKLVDLNPQKIGAYAEDRYAGIISTEGSKRVQMVKTFLSYLNRQKWVSEPLTAHLRVKKSKATGGANLAKSSITLTQEGYDNLTQELKNLREQKTTLSEEIGRALADGDVRENAPLEAARENQAMVSTRILEIENILDRATTTNAVSTQKVIVGTKVTLKMIDQDNRILQYQVVEQNEINPLAGKISTSSPVGAAVLNRKVNEEVAVETPRGTLRYRIESIN